jgi:streptomycin 3"-adenylyltransferase
MADDQIGLILAALRDVLGDELVGAYLHGSAILGGLRPRSDLDVMVVCRRRTTRNQKRRLLAALLAVSLRPRPVELTIVVEDEIRPWRYPPRMDFQYGEWWRADFERGEVAPWPSETNPDLAPLVRMVLLGDTPLLGPPAAEIFEPVPRRDYLDAMVRGIDDLLRGLESDTRNVVLTLARIWSSIQTDEVRSKDAAADWALSRLPAHLRPVLARAREIYLGNEGDRWADLRLQVGAYAEHVAAVIERLHETAKGGFGIDGEAVARTVVLVEGTSDQRALEALARRRGRDLDGERISILPIGGAKNIGSFLTVFGPQGFDVELAGLCDAAEEGDFKRGLERAGLGSNLTRADMESLGFYVCVADLEEELIRSLGAASVEQIIDAQGELGSFRTFQKQPAQQGKTIEEQLRRFMGTRGGRKIEYAPVLVDALDLTNMPRPLDGVLAHI